MQEAGSYLFLKFSSAPLRIICRAALKTLTNWISLLLAQAWCQQRESVCKHCMEQDHFWCLNLMVKKWWSQQPSFRKCKVIWEINQTTAGVWKEMKHYSHKMAVVRHLDSLETALSNGMLSIESSLAGLVSRPRGPCKYFSATWTESLSERRILLYFF